MADFLAELSALANLPKYAVSVALGDQDGKLARLGETNKRGTLIGYRAGYLVAVGRVSRGEFGKLLSIIVRFRTAGNPEGLKAAIKQDRALKKSGSVTSCGPQILVFQLRVPFGFTGAKALPVLDNLLAVVAQHAPGFKANACEECGAAAEIALVNRIPASLCPGCQAKLVQRQQEKRETYAALDVNYVVGTIYGLAGALIYVLGWGFGAGWLVSGNVPVKIGICVPFLAALMVAKLYSLGAKKVDTVGVGLTTILTAAALLVGDALYFTLVFLRSYAKPFVPLFSAVCHHLWELKSENGYLLIITLVQAVAVVCSGVLLWRLRPKFKAEFRPLPLPIPTLQAVAQAAGIGSSSNVRLG